MKFSFYRNATKLLYKSSIWPIFAVKENWLPKRSSSEPLSFIMSAASRRLHPSRLTGSLSFRIKSENCALWGCIDFASVDLGHTVFLPTNINWRLSLFPYVWYFSWRQSPARRRKRPQLSCWSLFGNKSILLSSSSQTMSVYASQELGLEGSTSVVNGYPLKYGDESKPRIQRACHLNRNSRCKTPSDIFIRLYVTLYIKHSNRVSIFVIWQLTSFSNNNTYLWVLHFNTCFWRKTTTIRIFKKKSEFNWFVNHIKWLHRVLIFIK